MKVQPIREQCLLLPFGCFAGHQGGPGRRRRRQQSRDYTQRFLGSMTQSRVIFERALCTILQHLALLNGSHIPNIYSNRAWAKHCIFRNPSTAFICTVRAPTGYLLSLVYHMLSTSSSIYLIIFLKEISKVLFFNIYTFISQSFWLIYLLAHCPAYRAGQARGRQAGI